MRDYDRLKALAQADPEQFQKLIREVNPFVVHPHPGQQQVLDHDVRFRVLNCGRRWGKTRLAGKLVTTKARKSKQILWWVAPTYKIVKRGYAEVLRQLPRDLLTHTPPPDTNFDAGRSVILRFKNRSRLEFYSAERPEGMLGEGVDYAVLDESATMPSRIWNQIVSPTLMDRLGGALLISTPRGRNWFYQAWQTGQDSAVPDWMSWTFPSWTNPYLPPGEVERMRRDLPRLEYEQEVEAKFLAAGSQTFAVDPGSIQHSAVLENNFIENFPPKGHVVLGIDLARTNDWTVIYGARVRDRRNCYFERMQAVTWPEQKRRIRRAVSSLERAGATGVTLVMDSTGVGDPIVEDLEIAGYDVVGINFTNNKNNMVRLLAKDLEDNRAFVLADANMNEFEDYMMSQTPAGRWTYSAPEGQHDDVVSAKMLQHHGLVNEGVPEATLIGADGVDPDTGEAPTEEEPWADLVDEEAEEDPNYAIGLTDKNRIPTTQELLVNPASWF